MTGRHRAEAAAALVVLLLAWEIAGRYALVAGGALPAPSQILVRFWADREDYALHVGVTLHAALVGFAVGNAVAILAGIAFVRWPLTATLSRGINVALFALPPIVVVPVLVLVMSGLSPRITLAALGCYFPTMTATVLGLTLVDPRPVDVVRAYGGGPGAVLRFVRLRSALPAILGGLRIAAPNAVLGAILAEFGGGGRWGLGAYLLGSLGRADPARLWGIGLVATLIAGLAYGLFALLALRVTGASRAVTVPASATPALGVPAGPALRVVLAVSAAVLPFLVWWALVRGFGLPELIAKTPAGVFDYLFLAERAAEARAKLGAALEETLPLTLLGMAAGLAAALALALLAELSPGLGRALLPVSLVTQSMPLVALTPLLVLLLGRGVALTLAVTVSVTFFPAFVTIAQGLAMTPQAALDVPRAYGASGWTRLRLVALPASTPYLLAAARLAVPRALLGVMIAEWLATGRGLGNLLNQSRGYLDYGMIWTVALVSILLSVAFYQAVVLVERVVLRRMGMQHG
jgi:ABC-type nitrate/sulfonate/bicarbonate transport system permease component